MKNIIGKLLVLSIGIMLFDCSHTTPKTQAQVIRQTLLDSTHSIEDSLILDLPDIPRLCDAMTVEKRYVDIGDCKLYCEIEGSGTPMLLINGGPGDSHHIFHPWLSEAASEFEIIYYDQRGCGLSDYSPGPGYSFEQAVVDLEKLRQALGIEKWVLVGHSFGGGLAQYYAIKYPERVIGQVLVASVPMVNREEFRGGRGDKYYAKSEAQRINELRNSVIAREISMPQYIINRDLSGGWKRQYFYKPSRERIIQNGLYDFVADPSYSSDWAAYEFEGAFVDCPIPTLIFEGKYDVVWNVDRPAIMGEFHPNAKVVVFEKSGHNIFADEPTRFVREISDWLETIKPATNQHVEQWSQAVHEIIDARLVLIESSKRFIAMIRNSGVETAVSFYTNSKARQLEVQIFFEAPMNALGYEYLFADKTLEAIEVFKLNALEFPESWNAYDSYAEALLAQGQTELAIQNYKRSITLNPENENGVKVLEGLTK